MKGFERKSIMVVSNIEIINEDNEIRDDQIEASIDNVLGSFNELQDGVRFNG